MLSRKLASGIGMPATPYSTAMRSLYGSNNRLDLDPCATTAVQNLRCGAVQSRTRNHKLTGMYLQRERGRTSQCAHFQYEYICKLEFAAGGRRIHDGGLGWRRRRRCRADVCPSRQV